MGELGTQDWRGGLMQIGGARPVGIFGILGGFREFGLPLRRSQTQWEESRVQRVGIIGFYRGI